jgi:hypothetical protein
MPTIATNLRIKRVIHKYGSNETIRKDTNAFISFHSYDLFYLVRIYLFVVYLEALSQ